MTEATHRLRPGLLAFEVALIAGIFWADEAGWVPLSKTPFLLLVAWGSLWLRGLGWRDVGLRLPEGWPRLAAIGVAAGIVMWLLEFFVTMPALRRLLGYWPDLTDFNDSVGNAALVVVNVAFGLAHLYQGPSGVIQATVGGVLLGILYVATGRNLVAPILAHGIGNSIDFIVMYLGAYPGVG